METNPILNPRWRVEALCPIPDDENWIWHEPAALYFLATLVPHEREPWSSEPELPIFVFHVDDQPAFFSGRSRTEEQDGKVVDDRLFLIVPKDRRLIVGDVVSVAARFGEGNWHPVP